MSTSNKSPPPATTNSKSIPTASNSKTDISNNVINFLRQHDGITGIDFVQSSGVSLSDITAFEQRESIALPDDYKSFLLTSDGFKLRWSVSFRTKIHPLGQLQLNRLRDVRLVPHKISDEWTSTTTADIGIETKIVRGRRIRMLRQIPSSVKVYEIDSTNALNTKVALLYNVGSLGATTNMNGSGSGSGSGSGNVSGSGSGSGSGKNTGKGNGPQIWYQDNSERWFFIANTFMDYFRLMVTHLGLPDWQSSYTDVGLDPTSRQWFNYLIPNKNINGNSGGNGNSMGAAANGVRSSSPLNSGSTNTSIKKKKEVMGAFFAALPSDTKRTKGLRTLRDVTGNADDPTSPIVRRNEINTNSSSSRSSGKSSKSGNSSSKNNSGSGSMHTNNNRGRSGNAASNWFDLQNAGNGTDRRRQMRPGSAPMRRRGRR